MGLLDFIPVIGRAVSSIGNAVSTNKTNKTNMSINQMNNEFNAAEAEKARQFQLDMWNRTNEYNSASAQRSRLEEAGLNPYLMMNGGSAGTAQSSGSSTPASVLKSRMDALNSKWQFDKRYWSETAIQHEQDQSSETISYTQGLISTNQHWIRYYSPEHHKEISDSEEFER
jgi:hypothetical protein